MQPLVIHHDGALRRERDVAGNRKTIDVQRRRILIGQRDVVTGSIVYEPDKTAVVTASQPCNFMIRTSRVKANRECAGIVWVGILVVGRVEVGYPVGRERIIDRFERENLA